MRAVLGDTWTMHANTSAARRLGWLPELGPVDTEREEELLAEAVASFEKIRDSGWHHAAVLAGGYYTSGKGFQKIATLCLLLEKLAGPEDSKTRECGDWLLTGFKCYYDPTAPADSCKGAGASYYDEQWGGIAARHGWDRAECNSDYGNTCYNDHHYHFGYFVVSAAVLAKLRPGMLEDKLFVEYVNTLIRDTANPTSEDGYFPRFRTFDWFDMHSWSHGIQPSHDGKDQESTSEELNLLYGIHLWGSVTGNSALAELGATMLSVAAHSIREYFLMLDGNPYHPEDFVRNRVTGVFSQGKVDYTTWFGGAPEYIHGIQMIPLSPALQLTRLAEFCKQEWDDILGKLNIPWMKKDWASIILTGGLAIIDPERAYTLLKDIPDGQMDNGLSRAFALYWAASKPGEVRLPAAPLSRDAPKGTSLLPRLGAKGPPVASVFPPKKVHPLFKPSHTQVTGPKATNKFWTNWVVHRGQSYAIFPMPYVLKWGGGHQLHVSHNYPQYIKGELGPGRMKAYVTPVVSELTLGAKEPAVEHVIVSEGLFGFETEVHGHAAGQTIRYPIYTGMAYISGRFAGGFTPVVSHPHGLAKVEKVRNGIWSFVNRRNHHFRVYVLDAAGAFADSSYDFDSAGRLNGPLDGWVRLAHVIASNDTAVLDAHARAVIVGCNLEVESGGVVRYAFQKEGASDVELLHWAYGHHIDLMGMQSEPDLLQTFSRKKHGNLV